MGTSLLQGSGELVIVQDLEGATLAHVTRYGIMSLKKLIAYTQVSKQKIHDK